MRPAPPLPALAEEPTHEDVLRFQLAFWSIAERVERGELEAPPRDVAWQLLTVVTRAGLGAERACLRQWLGLALEESTPPTDTPS